MFPRSHLDGVVTFFLHQVKSPPATGRPQAATKGLAPSRNGRALASGGEHTVVQTDTELCCTPGSYGISQCYLNLKNYVVTKFVVIRYGNNRKLMQWLQLETGTYNREDREGMKSPRSPGRSLPQQLSLCELTCRMLA